MKIFVLIVFVLMYVLIFALPKFKPIITGIVAVSVIIAGAVGIGEAFTKVDYNVILMLLGIMITVEFFTESKMPDLLADKLMSKMPTTIMAVVFLSVLSGFISAFLDNVATVLMLAPIGFEIAKKTKVSPIPVIISIAVSSNLQGAATLVGDTTSVMLGGAANMNFFDFFFFNGRFSIFWAVELGALITVPIIIFIFRKNNSKLLYEKENIEITSYFPTIMLLLNLALLVVSSFIKNKPEVTNGIICMVIGITSLLQYTIKYRGKGLKNAVKNMDFSTLFFLFFLFIVIGAVENVGIIDDISSFFVSIGDKNLFLLYTVIVFGSVIISAFIDNIPYVATMLPVISGIAVSMNAPENVKILLFFGLLIGSTLGGNLSPVGASANVVGIGFLDKQGYKVKFTDFIKIGVPFTLAAVLAGYVFVWFIWAY